MKAGKANCSCTTLEDNLKNALTELLILHLLGRREYFIKELTETLEERTKGVLKLVFPYSAMYRLIQDGHVVEGEKRIAPDGRKRQFYHITAAGLEYHHQLLAIYQRFIGSINTILNDPER